MHGSGNVAAVPGSFVFTAGFYDECPALLLEHAASVFFHRHLPHKKAFHLAVA